MASAAVDADVPWTVVEDPRRRRQRKGTVLPSGRNASQSIKISSQNGMGQKAQRSTDVDFVSTRLVSSSEPANESSLRAHNDVSEAAALDLLSANRDTADSQSMDDALDSIAAFSRHTLLTKGSTAGPVSRSSQPHVAEPSENCSSQFKGPSASRSAKVPAKPLDGVLKGWGSKPRERAGPGGSIRRKQRGQRWADDTEEAAEARLVGKLQAALEQVAESRFYRQFVEQVRQLKVLQRIGASQQTLGDSHEQGCLSIGRQENSRREERGEEEEDRPCGSQAVESRLCLVDSGNGPAAMAGLTERAQADQGQGQGRNAAQAMDQGHQRNRGPGSFPRGTEGEDECHGIGNEGQTGEAGRSSLEEGEDAVPGGAHTLGGVSKRCDGEDDSKEGVVGTHLQPKEDHQSQPGSEEGCTGSEVLNKGSEAERDKETEGRGQLGRKEGSGEMVRRESAQESAELRLSNGCAVDIVAYGVGSVAESAVARCQLALACLLARNIEAAQARVWVFDPVLTPLELRAIQAVGCKPIPHNEEGRRLASCPTVFVMPHCEAHLYNNVLEANSPPLGSLGRIAVLGNSFHSYQERWSVAPRPRTPRPTRLLEVEPGTEEIPVDPAGFPLPSAFNDMSWHFIPQSQMS